MSVFSVRSLKIENGQLLLRMTISVTEFKARCLEIFRLIEETGEPVSIERHGKVVGVLYPGTSAAGNPAADPFDRLIGTGVYLGTPEESAFTFEDFDAAR